MLVINNAKALKVAYNKPYWEDILSGRKKIGCAHRHLILSDDMRDLKSFWYKGRRLHDNEIDIVWQYKGKEVSHNRHASKAKFITVDITSGVPKICIRDVVTLVGNTFNNAGRYIITKHRQKRFRLSDYFENILLPTEHELALCELEEPDLFQALERFRSGDKNWMRINKS